ncbi:hypothetical protein DSECCO2_651810 [anaerobic digester metagenome]
MVFTLLQASSSIGSFPMDTRLRVEGSGRVASSLMPSIGRLNPSALKDATATMSVLGSPSSS